MRNLLFIFILVIATEALGRAGPLPLDADAKASFAAGVRAQKAGDTDGAIGKFYIVLSFIPSYDLVDPFRSILFMDAATKRIFADGLRAQILGDHNAAI